MLQHHSKEYPQQVTLETSGNLMSLRLQSTWQFKESTEASQAGKKSKMTGFSNKSRLAFARALAATQWPVQPSHVTLTYGRLTPSQTGDYFKKDLKALEKVLRRLGVVGFWRLEFQERKQACLELLSRCSCISSQALSHIYSHRRAAHFHLLVIGLTETVQATITKFWQKRTKNSSKYSVKVTEREAGRASWYLALHGQKESQAPDISVGRWWGYFGKARIQKLQQATDYGKLSADTEHRLRRILRRFLKRKSFGKRQSITVFMSEHTQAKLIHYLYTLEHEPEDLNKAISLSQQERAPTQWQSDQPF